jgi:hypothetical protein
LSQIGLVILNLNNIDSLDSSQFPPYFFTLATSNFPSNHQFDHTFSEQDPTAQNGTPSRNHGLFQLAEQNLMRAAMVS